LIVPDERRRLSMAKTLGEMGAPLVQFGTAADVLAATPPNSTGCAVIEHPLPDMTGCEIVERLSLAAPGLAVVVVAQAPTVSEAVSVMRKGAVDVLEWPVSDSALLGAVSDALKVADGRTARAVAAARLSRLAPRHLEVLRILLAGSPNKAVAARLGVGLRTAERLRSQTLEILGVRTVAEAAEVYRDAGSP
jgi:two-component system, LuxR family, response regulator FixJ